MNRAWVSWWDDAVSIGQAEAVLSGVRQRVYRFAGFWIVEPVS